MTAIDITRNVSQIKDAYPQGTARKILAQVLKDFVATTEADLNSVYVKFIKDLKENLVTILKFVKDVDSANDLSMAMLLQKTCKDPKVLAEDIIPKVQKFKSDLKWHSGADPIKIILDLTIFQSKQKSGSDIAVGQGTVELKNTGNPNKKVSETANTAAVGEKEYGSLVYNEDWLVKVLLNDLGYKDKV